MNNALLGNRGIISAHCVCTWKTESFASRSVPKRLLFCNRTSQVPTCPEMDRKLYGPSRLSAQTHIADLLARDSVLQKGEWQDGAANRHSWQTTFSNFFRGLQNLQAPKFVGKKDHGNKPLHVSHFILGTDKNPKDATTAADFEKKSLAPERACPDKGTSIPDFAPKYMSDRTFGAVGSVYVNSFGEGLKSGSRPTNKAARKQLTRELQATHFQLGNDNIISHSETTDSFKQAGANESNDVTPSIARQKAQDTYRSRVFRQGDWNEQGRNVLRDSVTRQDFHIRPFASNGMAGSVPARFVTREELKTLLRQFRPSIKDDEIDAIISECNPRTAGDKIDYSAISRFLTDDPNHPFYQRSTHFLFGSNSIEPRSLYHKDFLMGTKDRLPKPVAAAPPVSSKVLPILQRPPQHQTTNKTDFSDPTHDYKKMAEIRDLESKRNHERHCTQAVVLSCDAAKSAADRQSSVSAYDYPPPPSDFQALDPRHEPRSRYRYLDSDGTLPRPPVGRYCSEAKEHFSAITEGLDVKSKHTDCVKRIEDQHSSHFRLGSDVEPKFTEQNLQFNGRPALDPKVRAAGKSEGPEQKYRHVYPSESADKGVAPSVFRRDERRDLEQKLKQLHEEKHALTSGPVNWRRTFLEFDTSLSGKISRPDLHAACQKLGLDTGSTAFKTLYDQCEKDKSGYIDYQQFAKRLAKESPSGGASGSHAVSVMQADFCAPELRRISLAQRRLINAHSPVSVPSHYFHLHHSRGAPRLTTTAQDFARPDRMPGRSTT